MPWGGRSVASEKQIGITLLFPQKKREIIKKILLINTLETAQERRVLLQICTARYSSKGRFAWILPQ